MLLTKFVRHPFTDRAEFDWTLFREVVAVFTRMLDNVVELNGLPLEAQRQEIAQKRRHGMGYLGLGSACAMLGMTYGDEASLAFVDEVSYQLARTGWEVGVELAKEKGAAPILERDFVVSARMLSLRPDMAADGVQEGATLKGRVLMARYSRYLQRLAERDPALVSAIEKHGARFTHHTSIAPTGTIALSLGNNASNGIEPSFAHAYYRNVIRPGKQSKEQVEVASYELLAYRAYVQADASPDDLPSNCVTADQIAPEAHVRVQAAAQRWVDSSISKTINVPSEISYGAFKDIYLQGARLGLKGCTTYRFNPEAQVAVLVKKDDLANTLYAFTLEDGSTVTLRGDERVEYEGQTHVVANLYDALKEGYFGKF